MSAFGTTSVVLMKMRSQILECSECFWTRKALVRGLLCMLAQMCREMSLGASSIVAVRTLEWLLTRVGSQMSRQRRFVFASVVALIAGKRFFIAVLQLVNFEITRGECGKFALITLERTFTCVAALVFREMVFEFEGLVAQIAGEWTFVGMETFVNGKVALD